MTLVQLGERVACRLGSFAKAARARGMEPASFHLGARQFAALAEWAKKDTDIIVVQAITCEGIPVWRDERLHHIEIETIDGGEVQHLEKLLRL